ncbi:MAG: restriction endonuclease [bacterium]|nr:restriction endonuclease [bacterium]
MGYVLLIAVVIIIWIISAISEGISSISASNSKRNSFDSERAKKFPGRIIDKTKNIFDRNKDIIDKYAKRSETYGSFYYKEDNKIRDCINEICLAEGMYGIHPGSKYLKDWKYAAPLEWVKLSEEIRKAFLDRENELKNAEEKKRLSGLEKQQKTERRQREIENIRIKLRNLRKSKDDPFKKQEIHKKTEKGDICLDDIEKILTPNQTPWFKSENQLISYEGSYEKFPKIQENELKLKIINELNIEIEEYNEELENDHKQNEINKTYFKKIKEGYKKNSKEKVIQRLNYIVNDIQLPNSIPKQWDADYDEEQAIAIVEISLPDIIHSPVFKKVEQSKGIINKPLNQKETKENVPKIHPAIILRLAFEIFRNDTSDVIKLLVLNGWVEFIDPNTGISKKTYTATVALEKSQIINLNLEKISPLSALTNLNGKSAGTLIDIVPVVPVLHLNKEDKRFIDTKEVIGHLSSDTNLASMDWQDFESLIAELFEKEFENEGAEVKVTQASRDRGVDAIVFNPDPIKGGKYIIQAKRYTNVVDVSAVRDLCAVVRKEGASRGILVTTSTFGRDAYKFAQNEPITLLDGAQLLGLLEKHNYKFKIDLVEARKIIAVNEK